MSTLGLVHMALALLTLPCSCAGRPEIGRRFTAVVWRARMWGWSLRRGRKWAITRYPFWMGVIVPTVLVNAIGIYLIITTFTESLKHTA